MQFKLMLPKGPLQLKQEAVGVAESLAPGLLWEGEFGFCTWSLKGHKIY